MSDATKSVLDSAELGRVRDAVGERPDRIGPNHILGSLGAGGMGEVYKAERRSPIQQTVAIKIIKLGFDSREVLARFESERQALARMDHPHIARVTDAGISETGRPYFVMEYVPGVPITKFCDDNKLSIKDRLLLFTQACDAISHAHTKAIIHRDIKAANVLAHMHDGKPTVKVIDFGIAKALTGDRLTEATFNTDAGRIIGTYDSMSPEQAEGSPDIDTRTDVYSLGVLLYELLAGAKPFDHAMLARAADEEIKRIIREHEPPRPSTRLSELGENATRFAELRQAELESLTNQLRSELEWIPLKALRKERNRRYASPLQLRMDIENYLEGRPLIAGPESSVYRARKFLSRNRDGFAIGAALLIVLSVGTLATGWMYLRSEEQRRSAEISQTRAAGAARGSELMRQWQEAGHLVLHNMLSTRDLSVREALAVAAAAASKPETLPKHFDPEVRVLEHAILAQAYRNLGEHSSGERHLREGLALARSIKGLDTPFVTFALIDLASALQMRGKIDEAASLQREALAIIRATYGSQHPYSIDAVEGLARALWFCDELGEAEQLFREALAARRERTDTPPANLAESIEWLALVLKRQGKLSEAERLAREELAIQRVIAPTQPLEVASPLKFLSEILQEQGKLKEAEAHAREALAMANSEADEDPADYIDRLAAVLVAQRRFADAEPLLLDRYQHVAGARIVGELTPNLIARLRAPLERVVRLYEAWGVDSKAAEWCAKLVEFDNSVRPTTQRS